MTDDGVSLTSTSHPVPVWYKRLWYGAVGRLRQLTWRQRGVVVDGELELDEKK